LRSVPWKFIVEGFAVGVTRSHSRYLRWPCLLFLLTVIAGSFLLRSCPMRPRGPGARPKSLCANHFLSARKWFSAWLRACSRRTFWCTRLPWPRQSHPPVKTSFLATWPIGDTGVDVMVGRAPFSERSYLFSASTSSA